jgi:hypothetical protein
VRKFAFVVLSCFIFSAQLYAQETTGPNTSLKSGLRLNCEIRTLGLLLGYKWWLTENRALLVGVNIDEYQFGFLVYRDRGKAAEPAIKTNFNLVGQYEIHTQPVTIGSTKLSPFLAIGGNLGMGVHPFNYDLQPRIAIVGAMGVECFISTQFSFGIQQGLMVSYQDYLFSDRALTLGQVDLQSRCCIFGQIHF